MTHPELFNLWCFLRLIAKVALMTGMGVSVALAILFEKGVFRREKTSHLFLVPRSERRRAGTQNLLLELRASRRRAQSPV